MNPHSHHQAEQLIRFISVIDKDLKAKEPLTPTAEKDLYLSLRAMIEDVELENSKLYQKHVHDGVRIRSLQAQLAVGERHYEILSETKLRLQKERDQLEQDLLKLKEMLAEGDHDHAEPTD